MRLQKTVVVGKPLDAVFGRVLTIVTARANTELASPELP